MLHHSNPPAGAVGSHVHIFDPAFLFAEARHYTPGPAPPDAYLTQAAAWGVKKVVLVQPSPYGADNSALCAGLQRLGIERARRIAVIEPVTSGAQIEELKGHGVVGVGLNQEAGVQPQPELLRAELETLLEQVADHRLAVQLFVDCAAMEAVAGLLAASSVPVILDHFVEANGHHIVWGSDRPHTGGGRDRVTRPITQIEPFRTRDARDFLTQAAQWAGTEQRYQKLVVSNPHALFQF